MAELMQFTMERMREALLYRDDALLVVNKPVGLPVHRTPKGDENLEQYFPALRFELPHPPLLAHRLDKETSGCLVLGRHKKALARLGHLFETGQITKQYLAIVIGGPVDERGLVSQSIRRFDLGRGKWEFRIAPDGQEAVTEYEVLGRAEGYALLSLRPRTGRTHQLRLHCQWLGCPILGDRFYGGARDHVEQLFLHAARITIPYGVPPLTVDAPLPEHFLAQFARFGWDVS